MHNWDNLLSSQWFIKFVVKDLFLGLVIGGLVGWFTIG